MCKFSCVRVHLCIVRVCLCICACVRTLACAFVYCFKKTNLWLFLHNRQLMGIAIRTETPLNLDLSALVWKQLKGAALDLADLSHVDVRMAELLKRV